MEDFLLRAWLGGALVALASAPVGCLVVWRRMTYFGAALAHTVLLGVALGFWLDVAPTLAVLALGFLFAASLVLLERQPLLSLDALLGVLAHTAFAAGLLVVAFLPRLRVDLLGTLFGDILSVGDADLGWMGATAGVVGLAMLWQWRSWLAVTIHRDLAAVEGVPVARANLLFVFLLAAVIAVGMKIVGMLLVVALVIIPAAAARRVAATPEQMAGVAALIGVLSVSAGLWASLRWDLPAGPAIVLAASAFFFASLLARGRAR